MILDINNHHFVKNKLVFADKQLLLKQKNGGSQLINGCFKKHVR